MRACFTVLAGALAFHVPGLAHSQDYPSKGIRIVTTAAGGGSDFTARQIAQGLSSSLGWQVIVDNRASGVVSAEFAAKSPPDGYTLVVQGAALWTFPLLRKAPYDAERDFAPVCLISQEVFLVVVHPSLPVRSTKELIALAKSRPAQLNYAASGIGGPQHLATELFKSMAGLNIVGVPYKGAAASITGVISGEVQMMFADSGVVAPHVKAGKLRALAVTSSAPSALVPGIPPVAGSGVPGYEWVGMTHIMAPAKTPGAIINRLNQEIVRFLNLPQTKEQFLAAGSEIVASTPAQLDTAMKTQIAQMRKLIKELDIKTE